MNEVKQPRKPLIYYYSIAMMILLLLNFLVMPWLEEMRVQEVDYGTFMTMTGEGNIGLVQIDSTQITFTDKEEKQIYKTGLLDNREKLNELALYLYEKETITGDEFMQILNG